MLKMKTMKMCDKFFCTHTYLSRKDNKVVISLKIKILAIKIPQMVNIQNV